MTQGPLARDGLASQAIRSGVLLAGGRLASRLLVVARMVTVARWLGPEEMGVFGVAVLAMTSLDAVTETGLTRALIQRQGDVSRYIRPVRTVQALRGALLGLATFALAPAISGFFGAPQAVGPVRAIAALPLIAGLEPLFFPLSERRLQFGRVVALQSLAAAAELVVGLGLAWWRPDAWSLVIARLAGALARLAGCYVLSPDDRGLTLRLAPLRELRSFGGWIFASALLSYAFIRGGDWAIGRLLDLDALGLYTMAFSICTLATTEIAAVVHQVSFPVFSSIQDSPLRLRAAFGQSFGLVGMSSAGLACVLCAVAPDIPRVILGEEWRGIVPLVPWLALWSLCSVLAGGIATLFQALGRPRLWAMTVAVMLVIYAAVVCPATRRWGAQGVAATMAVIGVAMQGVRYVFVARLLRMRYVDVLRHVAIPLGAATLAFLATGALRTLADPGPFGGLLGAGVLSAGLYIGLLLALGRWMQPHPIDLLGRLLPRPGKRAPGHTAATGATVEDAA